MPESTASKRKGITTIESQESPAAESLSAADSLESAGKVWVLSKRFGDSVAIIGVYRSDESLIKEYPDLKQSGTLYRDCDSNGNGYTARSVLLK